MKKGVPVTLEIVSQDRHHGFRLSEFHLRADIQPGVRRRFDLFPTRPANSISFVTYSAVKGMRRCQGLWQSSSDEAKFMKPFVLGAISAYGICGAMSWSPVPDSACCRFRPMSLRAGWKQRCLVRPSMPRSRVTHPLVAIHAPSEENLIAGAKLYREMCSRCHGLSKDAASTYGQSFYPPAPQLALYRTSYTDQ